YDDWSSRILVVAIQSRHRSGEHESHHCGNEIPSFHWNTIILETNVFQSKTSQIAQITGTVLATVVDLSSSSVATETFADLIDANLASGVKSGYAASQRSSKR